MFGWKKEKRKKEINDIITQLKIKQTEKMHGILLK